MMVNVNKKYVVGLILVCFLLSSCILVSADSIKMKVPKGVKNNGGTLEYFNSDTNTWDSINETIESISEDSEGYDYKSEKGVHILKLKDDLSETKGVNVQFGEYNVDFESIKSFFYNGVSTEDISTMTKGNSNIVGVGGKNKKAVYQDVATNVHISYINEKNSVKEIINLTTLPTAPSIQPTVYLYFQSKMDIGDNLVIQADNINHTSDFIYAGDIFLLDKVTGESVFKLPRPNVTDNNGAGSNVLYGQYYVQFIGEDIYINTGFKWVKIKNYTYPIIIDPTLEEIVIEVSEQWDINPISTQRWDNLGEREFIFSINSTNASTENFTFTINEIYNNQNVSDLLVYFGKWNLTSSSYINLTSQATFNDSGNYHRFQDSWSTDESKQFKIIYHDGFYFDDIVLKIHIPEFGSAISELGAIYGEPITRTKYINYYTDFKYISESPLNYAVTGVWTQIDLTLEDTASNGWNLTVTKNNFLSQLKNQTTITDYIARVNNNGSIVQWNLQKIVVNTSEESCAIVDGEKFRSFEGIYKSNTIMYDNVTGISNNTILELKVEADRIKQNIYVRDIPMNNISGDGHTLDIYENFNFSAGLTLKIQEQDITGLNFNTEEEITFYNGTEEVFKLTKPFATDEQGNTIYGSYKGTYKSGYLEVITKFDYDWMKNASYPVLLDPSPTFDGDDDTIFNSTKTDICDTYDSGIDKCTISTGVVADEQSIRMFFDIVNITSTGYIKGTGTAGSGDGVDGTYGLGNVKFIGDSVYIDGYIEGTGGVGSSGTSSGGSGGNGAEGINTLNFTLTSGLYISGLIDATGGQGGQGNTPADGTYTNGGNGGNGGDGIIDLFMGVSFINISGEFNIDAGAGWSSGIGSASPGYPGGNGGLGANGITLWEINSLNEDLDDSIYFKNASLSIDGSVGGSANRGGHSWGTGTAGGNGGNGNVAGYGLNFLIQSTNVYFDSTNLTSIGGKGGSGGNGGTSNTANPGGNGGTGSTGNYGLTLDIDDDIISLFQLTDSRIISYGGNGGNGGRCELGQTSGNGGTGGTGKEGIIINFVGGNFTLSNSIITNYGGNGGDGNANSATCVSGSSPVNGGSGGSGSDGANLNIYGAYFNLLGDITGYGGTGGSRSGGQTTAGSHGDGGIGIDLDFKTYVDIDVSKLGLNGTGGNSGGSGAPSSGNGGDGLYGFANSNVTYWDNYGNIDGTLGTGDVSNGVDIDITFPYNARPYNNYSLDPNSGTISLNQGINFTWTPATDPESDAVTYYVYINYKNSTESSKTTKLVASGISNTYFFWNTTADNVTDQTNIKLIVKAQDSGSATKTAGVFAYFNTLSNEAPTTPTTLTPETGTFDINDAIIINCTGSTDTEADSFNYSIEAYYNISVDVDKTWNLLVDDEIDGLYSWDASSVPAQTLVDLRCRAKDNGSNTYGNYYNPIGNLTLINVSTCGVHINDSSITFGNTTIGTASDEIQILVNNTGTGTGDIAVTGTDWSGLTYTLDVNRTKFSNTSSITYANKDLLETTSNVLYSNLLSLNTFVSYWQVKGETGDNADTYSQTITFLGVC